MDEQGPRRLRELFRGRFTQEEAIRLIQQLGGVTEAVHFIFNNDPADINQILNRGEDYIETLRAESEMLNIRLEEDLESDSAEHLFACQRCERSWWKRVPNRKKVSKCYKCSNKYEPIPRHLEWGLGVFKCPNQHCRNEFKGKATMGMTKSTCHKCNNLVKVDHILPPRKGPKIEPKDHHNCNGINCFSPNPPDDSIRAIEVVRPPNIPRGERMELEARINGAPAGCYNQRGKPAICIHPFSKADRPANVRVRTWSQIHITTGSTVTTCLDQASLRTGTLSFAYSVETTLGDF